MFKDNYDKDAIKKYLTSDAGLMFYESVGSTNDVLKELALKGAAEGTAIVSRRQTKGKGRLGRSFYSPADTGVYLSILLRPDAEKDVSLITPMAAIAVSDTVRSITGKSAGIKWVNDVIFNGRKICGILCESVFDASGKPGCVIAGIGVNVFEPEEGFPDDIADKAGALYGREERRGKDIRAMTAAMIIDRFLDIYRKFDEAMLADEYKKRLVILGKRICVIRNGAQKPAVAVDTDKKCRLIVKYDDGTEELLYFGEVSCKLI